MEQPAAQISSEEPQSPLRLSQINRTIINGGYSKKGELATGEDALALGLHASDFDKIYICDRYAHLVMFHFKDDYTSTETDPAKLYEERARISAVRGWIMDTQTQTVVCRSFTEASIYYTFPEPLTAMDWTGWTFKPFVEGTTIRVFWDGIEWIHSTHRKIDCRNSRIPGVEIEVIKIFQECLPNLNYEKLDHSLVYVFQIVHQENQIMNPIPVPKPFVCHLATYGKFGFVDLNTIRPDVDGVPEFPYTIPDCIYLPDFILENAQALLRAGWCFVAIKDFEIVQVAAPNMEYMMKIRGSDGAPYIPGELMYLRLPMIDRPHLMHAVSYHLKEKTNPSYMEPWIKYNSDRLSIFCAQNLDAKLRGEGISLTKSLTWLLKCFKVPSDRKNLTVEQMHEAYRKIINTLAMENGATMYRCVRDMDVVMEKVGKLFQKHMAAQANPIPFQKEATRAKSPKNRRDTRKKNPKKTAKKGPPKKK